MKVRRDEEIALEWVRGRRERIARDAWEGNGECGIRKRGVVS